MKSTEHHSTSEKDLLGRLPKKSDNSVGPTVLTGRALSRSADTVHLAIAGGIVGVPIANIQAVAPVTGSRAPPNAVQIAVKNPQEIRSILRVGAVLASGVISGSVTAEDKLPDGFVVDTDRTWVDQGVGVSTCTYHDTDTVSGGQGKTDQLDDCPADECTADDE